MIIEAWLSSARGSFSPLIRMGMAAEPYTKKGPAETERVVLLTRPEMSRDEIKTFPACWFPCAFNCARFRSRAVVFPSAAVDFGLGSKISSKSAETPKASFERS